MIKKIVKGFGYLSLFLLVITIVFYLIYNQPLPKGKTGPEAEALAQKMLQAVGKEAWDTTNFVQWTFASSHHFLWDRQRNFVRVEWDKYRVLLNLENQQGKIFIDNQEQPNHQAILDKAYGYFINDAFWMNGFAQIYNGNPEHQLVDLEDGNQGLLVTYSSGGLTPGDSYLWILNQEGLPIAWRMWVGIIPIGGVYVSWENWETLASGAKIALDHKIAFVNIAISNVRTFQTWEEVRIKEDLFRSLL